MFKKITFVSILTLLMLTPHLWAQDDGSGRSGLYFGPQLGFHKSSDADDGNIMGGVALRLKLSQVLGVEGSINYRQEDVAGNALTVRSWPVMVTGMLYPLPIAYGALGAGWYNTTFDSESDLIDDETERKFGWHFGAGIELPVGTNAQITGDIRYVFLDYDFEDVPFDEVDSNFYVITAGLLFGL